MKESYDSNNINWIYYIPKQIPSELYEKEVIMGIKIFTISVCGLFVFPLMLLLLVQIKNFCSAQTTNERFSRTKRPNANDMSRTSDSSTDSINGKNDPESQELNKKLHHESYTKSSCCINCFEF